MGGRDWTGKATISMTIRISRRERLGGLGIRMERYTGKSKNGKKMKIGISMSKRIMRRTCKVRTMYHND